MVAQIAAPRTVLPLLVEPLRPEDGAVRGHGWRFDTTWDRRESRTRLPRLVRTVTRNHDDDAFGAFVQHVVVRYLVHGVERRQIARETVMSERQIQAYVTGRAWTTYTRAALAALSELGITHHRGLRPRSSADRERPTRHMEIIAAQDRVLAHALDCLAGDPRDAAQAVMRLARLLAAGREPVRAP